MSEQHVAAHGQVPGVLARARGDGEGAVDDFPLDRIHQPGR
jgi:hypothetical protein